jgi:hypothetical protein
MRRRALLFLMGVLFTSSSYAADISIHRNLRYGISVPREIAGNFNTVISPALSLVLSVGPKNYSFQNAENNFDFVIEFVTEKNLKDVFTTPEITRFTQGLNGDAFTFLFPGQPKKTIVVRVLWERAMMQKGANAHLEKPNAFTSLLTVLAHELFGNVIHFYENAILKDNSESDYTKNNFHNLERLEAEIFAFQKGIEALEEIKARYATQLLDKTKADITSSIKAEKVTLLKYQDALKVLMCEGNFTPPP